MWLRSIALLKTLESNQSHFVFILNLFWILSINDMKTSRGSGALLTSFIQLEININRLKIMKITDSVSPSVW